MLSFFPHNYHTILTHAGWRYLAGHAVLKDLHEQSDLHWWLYIAGRAGQTQSPMLANCVFSRDYHRFRAKLKNISSCSISLRCVNRYWLLVTVEHDNERLLEYQQRRGLGGWRSQCLRAVPAVQHQTQPGADEEIRYNISYHLLTCWRVNCSHCGDKVKLSTFFDWV